MTARFAQSSNWKTWSPSSSNELVPKFQLSKPIVSIIEILVPARYSKRATTFFNCLACFWCFSRILSTPYSRDDDFEDTRPRQRSRRNAPFGPCCSTARMERCADCAVSDACLQNRHRGNRVWTGCGKNTKNTLSN